jgi:tape measure domain-containing protein
MALYNAGVLFTIKTTGSKSLDDVGRRFNKLSRDVKKLELRLNATQAVMLFMATTTLTQLGRSIIKVGGEFQNVITRLARVEGSVGKAREQFALLNKEFGTSVFAITDMADAYAKLRAAGLGDKDANDILRGSAEAVAAFGGNTALLERLVIGMVQSIGKGTLSMEEMRQQIGEAVPSAMRLLAQAYNTSIADLYTRIENGAIDSTEAMKLLAAEFKKEFGGALAAQANTIEGSLSAMNNQIKAATGNFVTFNSLAGAEFVNLVQQITAATAKFINEGISNVAVKEFFDALNNVLGIVKKLTPAFQAVALVVLGFFNTITTFINSEAGFILTSGLVAAILFGSKKDYLSVGRALIGLITVIAASFREQLQGLGEYASSFLTAIGGIAGWGLVGYIFFGKKQKALGAAFGAAFGIVELAFRTFMERTAELGGDATTSWGKALESMFSSYGNKTRDTVANISNDIRKGMEESTQFVNKATTETVRDLEKLRDRVKFATIDAGSETANKLQNQLDKLIIKASEFGEKLGKQDIQAMTPSTKKNFEEAAGQLEIMLMLIKEIQKSLGIKVSEGMDRLATKVARHAENASAALLRMEASVAGDEATKRMMQLEARSKGVATQLDKVYEGYRKLGDKEGMARVEEMRNRLNAAQDRGIGLINREVGANNALAASKERLNQLDIQAEMLSLRREQRGGLVQSFTSAFSDQAEDRRLELQRGIADTQERILAAEKELITATGERRTEIGNTISLLQQFQQQQQQALEETSAAGLLAQDTWKSVGDAIQGSLKGALRDLVKGTFDAEKALLSFYDKITDAAIDYLFELIKIQFRQQIIASLAPLTGGGAGGGILGMFLGGFANGGAFRGGVTPFADGGIVRGPTMFGLAGENGDEAILPLERIGGKLGVNAVGGDGGSYTININAIDTQSGAQFLQKNSQQIIAQLRAADRLNRGYGNLR